MVSTTIFRLRFNRNYTTFVKTSHGHVRVDFTPIVLLGRTENSQFGTADPEEVEALKKHRDFGSLFYIEEEGREVPAKAASGEGKQAEPAKEQEGGKDSAEAGTGGQPAPADEGGDNSGAAADGGAESGDGAGAETGESGADTLTHEKTVTSKNKAIAYLLEKHGATFSQTADIAQMKEEALTVYNLVFDNWK